MARIALTIEGANIGSVTVGFNLADTDADRVLAAMKAAYPNDDGTQPDGETAVRRAADGIAKGLLANVHRTEREQAAQAAAELVQPIEATPE